MAPTKDTFARALEGLVHKFDSDRDTYRSPGYGEAQARSHFITPFFKALGWDVENEQGLPYHLCEVWEEKGETQGRPDYTFRIGGQTRFFVEAKAPSEQLDSVRHVLQTKRYAWNSRDIFFAGLTDFEEFLFFDASLEPDERRPRDGEAFHLLYTEYLKEIDRLWELSKERVAEGSLDQFLRRDRKSIRYRIKVDERFLDDLTEWRHDLAKSIYVQNPGLDPRLLNDIVQRLLDRIVFIRIAEDRRVIEDRQLWDLAELWEQRGGKRPITEDMVALFQEINRDFNGEIFKPHPCEQVKVESHVLAKIIRRLYPPKSPYRFDVIGVELLGSIYERYLGNTIRVTAKQVRIEPKPEVRKAGGVYYTPQFIVDYIVKNTVGKLVEGKKPREVQELRILDPACGSGSFLLGAFQFLIDWHEKYYAEHTKETRIHPTFHEAEKDDKGNYRLTFRAKTQILVRNLYGVDLDPQAVEITMMSLYLKALEGEKAMLGPKHEKLPELKYNIRCGNSLIAPDIEKEASLTAEERERIRPFDWNSKQEGFGDILGAGGFDAVIGNPPWGADFSEVEKLYLDTHFKLGVGKYESYIYFLERAVERLGTNGQLGFIVPSYWISRSQTEALRAHLSTALTPTGCIVLPEDIFAGVKMDSCIVTATNRQATSKDLVLIAEVTQNDLERFSAAKYENLLRTVPLSEWKHEKRLRFNPRVTMQDLPILQKAAQNTIKLDAVLEITQGLTLYRESTLVEQFGKAKAEKILKNRLFHADRKKNKTFKKELLGRDVGRYRVKWNEKSWVSYGPWLAHAVDEKFFRGPRIVIQKIRNPMLRRRIVAGYLDDDETYSAGVLLNAIPRGGPYSIFYCLGLLNSKLINYWYRKLILDVSIRVIDLKEVPARKIDFSDVEQRALHERLVGLVQRMLAVRARDGSDSAQEAAKLDLQIDSLVYDLYSLTAEERKIVEESIPE